MTFRISPRLMRHGSESSTAGAHALCSTMFLWQPVCVLTGALEYTAGPIGLTAFIFACQGCRICGHGICLWSLWTCSGMDNVRHERCSRSRLCHARQHRQLMAPDVVLNITPSGRKEWYAFNKSFKFLLCFFVYSGT